jgi:UDP-N-acetyl-D-mannosaminuronic acid transferase (WecB/TagA/CpsF family)
MQPSASLSMRAHALVLNVNAHCLNLAQEIIWLSEMLNSADLVFCDSAGNPFTACIMIAEVS